MSEKEFVYKAVYLKTGGVLNIFNPKMRESMDSEFKKLFSLYEDEKEGIRIWNGKTLLQNYGVIYHRN